VSITDQFWQYAKEATFSPAPPKPTRTGAVCLSLRGSGRKGHHKSRGFPLRVSSVRLAQRDFVMSIDLFMNDTCPKCRKPIKETNVTSHPTRYDLAIHCFECADCGVVKTKVLMLIPDPRPAKEALYLLPKKAQL
jgi:hypothetical protein